ncbi:hypothetical protein [Streptomyces vinaceus]|uniref:hypothetical protein n=1 Tax=Streptomyces vinaceus TaxID=1960 RepID=UPI0036A3D288
MRIEVLRTATRIEVDMPKLTGTATLSLTAAMWEALRSQDVRISAVAPATVRNGSDAPVVSFSSGTGEVDPTGSGGTRFAGGLRLDGADGAFIELTDPVGVLPAGKAELSVRTAADGDAVKRVKVFEYTLVKSLKINPLGLSFSIGGSEMRVTQEFAAILSEDLDGFAVELA